PKCAHRHAPVQRRSSGRRVPWLATAQQGVWMRQEGVREVASGVLKCDIRRGGLSPFTRGGEYRGSLSMLCHPAVGGPSPDRTPPGKLKGPGSTLRALPGAAHGCVFPKEDHRRHPPPHPPSRIGPPMPRVNGLNFLYNSSNLAL